MNPTQEWMNQRLMDFNNRLVNRDAVLTAGAKATSDYLPVQVRETRTISELSQVRRKQDDPRRVVPAAPILQSELLNCCMYPNPFVGDGSTYLYDDTDLPDQITVNGVTYSRTTGLNGYSYTASGLPPSEPITESFVAAFNNIGWIYVTFPLDQDQCTFQCLTGTYPPDPTGDPGDTTFADFFDITYTVNLVDTIAAIGDPTITCLWNGDKSGGGKWFLRYLGIAPPIFPAGLVQYVWNLYIVTAGVATFVGQKTGLQSTPVGSYTDGVTTYTVT